MTTTAIIFMIFGLTIEWGGVILAITNQMKNDARVAREEAAKGK